MRKSILISNFWQGCTDFWIFKNIDKRKGRPIWSTPSKLNKQEKPIVEWWFSVMYESTTSDRNGSRIVCSISVVLRSSCQIPLINKCQQQITKLLNYEWIRLEG